MKYDLKTYLVSSLIYFVKVITISLFVVAVAAVYVLGSMRGYSVGYRQAGEDYNRYFEEFLDKQTSSTASNLPSPTKAPTPTAVQEIVIVRRPTITWGGPELWEAVNKRRTEFGVNPLQSRGELCTIASIRLNELLDLGKLDGHEGFSNLRERRPDLEWIFEKYAVVAEFLAAGGLSAQETVSMWEGTLGHKKILDGGEYVWGCVYAQNSFAVAISAY
jgi:uncharacterized protein YkwD